MKIKFRPLLNDQTLLNSIWYAFMIKPYSQFMNWTRTLSLVLFYQELIIFSDIDSCALHTCINLCRFNKQWIFSTLFTFSVPKVVSGKTLPRRKQAFTTYQRMSAINLIMSNLDEAPALHTTDDACPPNLRHGAGFYHGKTIMCPWPINFLKVTARKKHWMILKNMCLTTNLLNLSTYLLFFKI